MPGEGCTPESQSGRRLIYAHALHCSQLTHRGKNPISVGLCGKGSWGAQSSASRAANLRQPPRPVLDLILVPSCLGRRPMPLAVFKHRSTGQEGSLLHSSPQKGLIGVTVGRRSAAEDMTHARCARATRLGRVRRRRQRHRGLASQEVCGGSKIHTPCVPYPYRTLRTESATPCS